MDQKFCPQCGGAIATHLLKTADLAERRVVTVLFCDLVGSTQLSQELDIEDWRQLLTRYHQVCGDLVQAAGGHVAQYLGDGVLAYFGWPRAHEDDAARALRCALKIVRRLDEQPRRSGNRLQARLGIDSGTVVVSEVGNHAMRENLVLGEIPNVAARLQSLAEPGVVLATERTWHLAQGYFNGTSLGHPALKGVAQPPEVWRVEGETGARSRLEAASQLSPFVGRDVELGQVLAFVDDPFRGVRLLDVAGEPGLGKSRLLIELRALLRTRAEMVVLFGTCGPDRQSAPLSAFAEVFRGLRTTAGQDDASGVARLLQAASMDTLQNRGLLALLLDEPPPVGSLDALDGTLIGLRTHDLLLELLLNAGQRRRVVLLLEDLHWLDAASKELLVRIVDTPESVAVRLISTRRPEYLPPWQAARGVQSLSLPPLSVQDTSRIIAARFGARSMADIASQLAVRADGNALFAEELANFVAAGVRLGAEKPLADAVLQSMPDSVRSLLDARVDALEDDDQALLRVAAVIGRRFDVELVAELVPQVDSVSSRIERFIAIDILVRIGKGVCEFKHALIQDALYGRFLRSHAAQLHDQVARQLEKRHALDLDGVAEALAYHWSRTDQTQKAVVALTRAGKKAMNRFALEDAARHLQAAEALVDSALGEISPGSILSMLRPLLHLLYMRMEVTAAIHLCERHLEVVRAQLPRPDAIQVLSVYAMACCVARRMRPAKNEVESVWVASLEQLDLESRAWAATAYLGVNAIAMEGAGPAYEQVLAEAERLCAGLGDPFLVNELMTSLAWDALYRGRHARVIEIALRLAARGQQLGDPRAESVSLWLRAWVEFNDERYVECITKAERVIQIAVTPHDQMQGLNLKGLSLIFSGRPEEGIELVEHCLQVCRGTGALYTATVAEYGYPAALVMTGHFAKGMAKLDTAIDESVRCEDHRLIAQQRAMKAEILMSLLDPPSDVALRDRLRLMARNLGFMIRVAPRATREAEALLQQALDYPMFGDPEAYWYARLTTNLALLYSRHGLKEVARERLNTARELAAKHDARTLIRKVDGALARLG